MVRPKKYTDRYIRRLAVKLIQYAKKSALPFKQDFASKHKFSSQRMSEFTKVPEFAEALQRFEDIQQFKIIGAAMLNKINATFAIFTLKNVAKWRDVAEFQGPGGSRLIGNQTNNIHLYPNKILIFKDMSYESSDTPTGTENPHAEESPRSLGIIGQV